MSQIAESVATLPASRTMEKAKPDTLPRSLQGISPVWNRALLLFGALCLIKIAMLFDLRKHLYEIHWRTSTEPSTWVNHAAFYLFAVLAGSSLFVLALRCERGGARVVRGANACVLVLSALFILLTLSENGQSYLSMVVNPPFFGLKDLRWYFLNNFCFGGPYLMLWIAGYAAVYWALFRKGREYLALRVTAICAAAFVIFYLRDLIQYRETLFVVDSIGVATVFGGWKATRRLNPLALGALLGSMAFFFMLFRNYETMLEWPWANWNFIILSGFSVILFAGITVLAHLRGFSIGWSWMLPFAFMTFLLFINTNYVQAHNYYNFLCVGLTLPRYFLGELMITLLWFAAARLYRWWRPSGSLLWLDTGLLLLIAIALIDYRLTQIMSVRLDWQVLSLAFGETPKMMWRMSRPYLLSLSIALAAMAGIYAGLLIVMGRVSVLRNQFQEGQADDGGNVEMLKPRFADSRWSLLAFLLLGLAGAYLMDSDKARGQALTLLATTSPLWQRTQMPLMDAATFTSTARKLHIWQSPDDATQRPLPRSAGGAGPAASGSAQDMNVVVIFQESTYNKFLSLFNCTNDTEPLLSKYKDRMELFPNFYSSFAGSINARFSSFTGLYPVADYNAFTTHHVPVKSLFEVLHENGYSNSLFYSSFFDYTGFRDFLKGRDIEGMYDADTMPSPRTNIVSWGLREDETLSAMKGQIKKYAAAKQKFCLTYVPAAPHNPFDGIPDRFRNRTQGALGDFTPAYLNELTFMDWVLTSIVDQLKDSGLLDKTLIVITGDHGEMLGDHGGPIGHGWAFTPELGNVPLIIMNPKRPGYRINDTLGSQVDMLPTLLDLLGIPLPADQLYQGTSLYSANADPKRTIYLNTFRQYGILESGVLFCGNRVQRTRVEGPVGFYSYTNDGARTMFQLLDRPPAGESNLTVSISAFDRFQANFLHNYSQYCRIARQTVAVK